MGLGPGVGKETEGLGAGAEGALRPGRSGQGREQGPGPGRAEPSGTRVGPLRPRRNGPAPGARPPVAPRPTRSTRPGPPRALSRAPATPRGHPRGHPRAQRDETPACNGRPHVRSEDNIPYERAPTRLGLVEIRWTRRCTLPCQTTLGRYPVTTPLWAPAAPLPRRATSFDVAPTRPSRTEKADGPTVDPNVNGL